MVLNPFSAYMGRFIFLSSVVNAIVATKEEKSDFTSRFIQFPLNILRINLSAQALKYANSQTNSLKWILSFLKQHKKSLYKLSTACPASDQEQKELFCWREMLLWKFFNHNAASTNKEESKRGCTHWL